MRSGGRLPAGRPDSNSALPSLVQVSIPIYIVACLITIVVGFMADRTSRRTLYSIVLSVLGVVGYIILIANDPKHKPGVSYFAIYLAAIGMHRTAAFIKGAADT